MKDKLTPEDIKEIEWQVYHEINLLEFLEIASKTRNDTVKWINIINACNNYEVLTEDNRRGYAKELGEILSDYDAIIFKMDKVILKYKEAKEYAMKPKMPKGYEKEEKRHDRAEESEEKKHESKHDKAMIKAIKGKKKPCK